ncbi:hypothetical protein Pmani_001413 [Petrolisthes manimaculis]|uniref:Uncharacterized protein n=1 Tax=Petrolisthes manimaculis TaxID=1843537 RepID=A0AAE1URL0_9EUCA|nr:hypothetical protein Pmani_001413 [Petrolisthes manimaculis]
MSDPSLNEGKWAKVRQTAATPDLRLNTSAEWTRFVDPSKATTTTSAKIGTVIVPTTTTDCQQGNQCKPVVQKSCKRHLPCDRCLVIKRKEKPDKKPVRPSVHRKDKHEKKHKKVVQPKPRKKIEHKHRKKAVEFRKKAVNPRKKAVKPRKKAVKPRKKAGHKKVLPR